MIALKFFQEFLFGSLHFLGDENLLLDSEITAGDVHNLFNLYTAKLFLLMYGVQTVYFLFV